MTFSVVVPTHNRPVQLRRLLDSLAAQSLSADNFEVLVVPSPGDASLQWLKGFTSPFQLKVLDSSQDPYAGRSASYKRNNGAWAALGDWIAFIDDDCVADRDWLASALHLTADIKLHGIEGFTKIPPPPAKTLTYKGLVRLSSSGGYQTCNMFYRRLTFIEVGGFDLNFPFYLEDTDLAWSFLERDRAIVFSPQTIVEHPVPPAETARLLANARRVRKIPYLFKKHPALYKASGMQPINRVQWIYLLIYLGALYSIAMRPTLGSIIFLLSIIVAFNALYTARLLWGCKFDRRELLELFCYLPVAPLIAIIQLVRGNIDNRTLLFFNR